MNKSIKYAKASLLLYLIYYHDRSTLFHYENVGFFKLSDEKVCNEFMTKLHVSKSEFENLIDLLIKKNLLRYAQHLDGLYVHLNDRACHFVLTEDKDDRPYLLRNY